MATKKEKQLATILLKERIERLTGKKVIFKEGVYTVLDKWEEILARTLAPVADKDSKIYKNIVFLIRDIIFEAEG
jgi:hypothetical protein